MSSVPPKWEHCSKGLFSNGYSNAYGCEITERVVAVLLDEQGIDRRDIKPGFMEDLGDTLIVASGVLHNHPWFALNRLEVRCQRRQILGIVVHIEGQLHNLAKRRSTATVLFLLETSIPAAFMFITPEKNLQWTEPSLPIADSICLLTRTRGSTCTNRTLQTGRWLTDLFTGTKPLEDLVRPLHSHSNSLGNEMSHAYGWLP